MANRSIYYMVYMTSVTYKAGEASYLASEHKTNSLHLLVFNRHSRVTFCLFFFLIMLYRGGEGGSTFWIFYVFIFRYVDVHAPQAEKMERNGVVTEHQPVGGL